MVTPNPAARAPPPSAVRARSRSAPGPAARRPLSRARCTKSACQPLSVSCQVRVNQNAPERVGGFSGFGSTEPSEHLRPKATHRLAEGGYRLEAVTEDTSEIFDDLYVAVRAGGALRKQRRGEELTHEEREALTRWERLSPARKAAAI